MDKLSKNLSCSWHLLSMQAIHFLYHTLLFIISPLIYTATKIVKVYTDVTSLVQELKTVGFCHVCF